MSLSISFGSKVEINLKYENLKSGMYNPYIIAKFNPNTKLTIEAYGYMKNKIISKTIFEVDTENGRLKKYLNQVKLPVIWTAIQLQNLTIKGDLIIKITIEQ